MTSGKPRGPRRSQKRLESVQRNRQENLRILFSQYKRMGIYPTVREFCEAFAQAPAIYYALAGPNPTKGMGEGLARDIEARLKLPAGYLDVDPKMHQKG